MEQHGGLRPDPSSIHWEKGLCPVECDRLNQQLLLRMAQLSLLIKITWSWRLFVKINFAPKRIAWMHSLKGMGKLTLT